MPKVVIIICANIDITMNKNDCFILNSKGDILIEVSDISNNTEKSDILQ